MRVKRQNAPVEKSAPVESQSATDFFDQLRREVQQKRFK